MPKVERLKTIYETIAPYITRSESSWKEYLSFAARLHKHSFDTALLVYAQNPNVTTLASTAQWNHVGRYVNRGEKGIAVCEYSNTKLTLSHLFDISQTNGKPVTLTDWNVSEDMQSEIVKRMTSGETAFPVLLSKISSDVTYKNYSRYFNSIKSNVSSGHIFFELPEAGLESQFIELLSDSITYMTAKRCGLADEDIPQNDGMNTISHFNTIPLIATLGSAVTALSKSILLEIERTIKTINYERTTQNERPLDRTRLHREERDTLPKPKNLERRDSRSTARTVRQNGDGVPQAESPRPLYSFENGWESDGDNAQGAGRSDREDRNADTANAGNRPTTKDRGHIGESETLQQPEAVSGGSRDTGDRIDSEVTAEVTVPVSEQSNTHEQEPSHDGSFSLPLAEYLERMMLTTLFYNLNFFSRLRYINASGDSDERKAERIKAAYFSEGDKSGEIENTPVSITVSDTSLTFHIGSDGVYDCSFEWNTIQELVRGYIENGSFPEQNQTVYSENITVKKRATLPERNFKAFEKLFPQIVSGEYISLRLEAGESFDPLVISHKYDNRYSMEHYYLQNGDTLYDPYIVFLLDTEAKTMQSAAYENSGLGIYQEVYVEGGYYPKLQKDLNNFISSWLKNISSQGYMPVRAITLVNDEEVEIQFDKEGNPVIEEIEDISFDDESAFPQPPIETVQQPSSDITRIENLAKGIQKQLQLAQQGLDDIKRQLEECHAQYGRPFLYEAELSEKSAKLTEINTTLELGGSKQDEVILDEDSQDKRTANRDEISCEVER